MSIDRQNVRGKRQDLIRNLGFTLMEMMVVVLLIGVIASFAFPTYTNTVEKSHESDIIKQLETIHAANLYYFAENGEFWDTANAWEANLATINSTLNIQLVPNTGTTYRYRGNGSAFDAEGVRATYTVRINENPVDSSNPTCQTGTCPSL